MQLEVAKKSRNRGVKLNSEALQLLNETLSQLAGVGDPSARLTRREAAQLMQVSEGTAKRILEEKRVDRTTLRHVFAVLNLTWSENYLHCDHDLDHQAGSPLVATNLKGAPHRSLRWVWGIAVLVALPLLYAGTAQLRQTAPNPEEAILVRMDQLITQGIEDFRAARYAEARVKVDEGMAMARKAEEGGRLATALRASADIHASQGDLTFAIKEYNEAIALRKLLKETGSLPALWLEVGGIESRLGNFVSAKRYLHQALKGFMDLKISHGVAESQRDLGMVSFREGDFDAAQSWYSSARATLVNQPEAALLVDVEGREALVLRETGRLEEAKAKLTKCLAYWREKGHPKWIARIQLYLGTVQLRSGEVAQAKESLAQSLHGFKDLGDKLGAAECQQELKKCEGALSESSENSVVQQVKAR